MANTSDKNKKSTKLSLVEYAKLKEKIGKSKLQLHFPLMIKLAIAVPLAYLLFMLIYYIVHLRHLAEH